MIHHLTNIKIKIQLLQVIRKKVKLQLVNAYSQLNIFFNMQKLIKFNLACLWNDVSHIKLSCYFFYFFTKSFKCYTNNNERTSSTG